MKKNMLIAGVVTAGMFGINWLLAHKCGFILGIEFFGGEVIEWIGFGVYYAKFYPMTSSPEEVVKVVPHIGVEPISLVATFLIAFLIVSVVRKCISKKKLA